MTQGPPSYVDFIQAENKAPLKITNSVLMLSIAAPSFFPQTTNFISISTLDGSSPPVSVPVNVVKGRPLLLLSTLQHYFPLATDLHYSSRDQLVTLASSSSFTVNQGILQLSHKQFCIPYLDRGVIYVVTDDREFVSVIDDGSIMDGILRSIRDIQTGVRANLAEMERVEELVRKVQGQVKRRDREMLSQRIQSSEASTMTEISLDINIFIIDECQDVGSEDINNSGLLVAESEHFSDDVVDASEDVSKIMKNITELHLVEVPEKYENSSKIAVSVDVADLPLQASYGPNIIAITDEVSMKDENHNYVDDYGFSDSENDSDEVIVTTKDLQSVHDNVANILSELDIGEKNKIIQTSFPEPSCTPESPKQEDTYSPSSRPRCVRRVAVSKKYNI